MRHSYFQCFYFLDTSHCSTRHCNCFIVVKSISQTQTLNIISVSEKDIFIYYLLKSNKLSYKWTFPSALQCVSVFQETHKNYQCLIMTILFLYISDPKEYCENEVFRAACGSDEVIVMQSARYGRMRISKCIDRDYGYVGCSADVLPKADRLCSGKRKCEVPVPNPTFSADVTLCPRDLKPYLEVAYKCVKGELVRVIYYNVVFVCSKQYYCYQIRTA